MFFSSPVVSYHFGAGNTGELKNILKKSLVLVAAGGGLMLLSSQLLALPMARVFVGYDESLMALTAHGLRLFAFSFAVFGFNIFGSAFFTALNDGLTSAAISFLRTLVFQTASVLLLPMLMPAHLKLDGIWLSIVAAELLSMAVTVFFLLRKRQTYGYA
jgi:Na+-driven multidrug efflux pump